MIGVAKNQSWMRTGTIWVTSRYLTLIAANSVPIANAVTTPSARNRSASGAVG